MSGNWGTTQLRGDATPKQLEYIARMSGELDLKSPAGDLSKAEASEIITELRDVLALRKAKEGKPDKPHPWSHPDTSHAPLVGPGVYRMAGEIYVVKGNKAFVSWRKHDPDSPQPPGARIYAKILRELPCKPHDDKTPFELAFVAGAVNRLRPEDQMTLADAAEAMARYSQCMVCGRELKDKGSIAPRPDQMNMIIGPVCVKNFR